MGHEWGTRVSQRLIDAIIDFLPSFHALKAVHRRIPRFRYLRRGAG